MKGWKECPGCQGRGFWYSDENGQAVTCKNKPNQVAAIYLSAAVKLQEVLQEVDFGIHCYMKSHGDHHDRLASLRSMIQAVLGGSLEDEK